MFLHEDLLWTFIFVHIARSDGYLVLCFEVDFGEKAWGFYRLGFDFMLLVLSIGNTKIRNPVLFVMVFGREMHYYYFSKKIVNSENRTKRVNKTNKLSAFAIHNS